MPRKTGEFVVDIDAEALKRGIRAVAQSKVEEIEQAVSNVAHATYAAIVAKAQKKLTSTRSAYVGGMKFETISPNNYVIYLDGNWANAIEDGWSPYDMKETLLKSKKTVSEGSRAGLPWVQKGKKGQRYAKVPFEHSPRVTGATGASDLAGVLKNLSVMNLKTNKMQKLTSTFKDDLGKPLQGKVATYRSSPEDVKRGLTIPNLEGLTKYQKVYTTFSGKQRVKSAYLTFRTISDLSPASKWQNKGYSGLRAFPEAEAAVRDEIQNILRIVLG